MWGEWGTVRGTQLLPSCGCRRGDWARLPCPPRGLAQGRIRLQPLPSLSAAEAPFLDALQAPSWASPPLSPSWPICLLPGPRWPHCDQLSSVPHVPGHPWRCPQPGGVEGPVKRKCGSPKAAKPSSGKWSTGWEGACPGGSWREGLCPGPCLEAAGSQPTVSHCP